MIDLRCGDARDVLTTLDDASVDAVVTDPPAGVSFMGKDWDGHKGGRDQWIAWLAGIMAEARRCVKPGGYALVWALPRTSHWTAMALEDAGWTIRDSVAHMFGSGFPKSHSCLKPAHEVWWLAKAPGPLQPLQIDACRVATGESLNGGAYAQQGMPRDDGWGMQRAGAGEYQQPAGRWPPNTLLSHHSDCQPAGVRRVPGHRTRERHQTVRRYQTAGTATVDARTGPMWGHADADGYETVDAWMCVDGCPIKALDAQAGPRTSGGTPFKRAGMGYHGADGQEAVNGNHGDTGSASRFFPCFGGVDHNASTRYTDGRGAGVNRCRKLKHGGISVSVTDAGIGPGANLEAASSTANLSTDGSGSKPTARFRRVTRFTTATTTKPTTASRTLNSSRRRGTTTTTSACASITASSTEARSAAARPAESGSLLAPTLFDGPEPITGTARSAPPRPLGHGKRQTVRRITLSAALITPRASQPWRRASACIVVSRSRPTMQRASTAQTAAVTPHPTGAHIHLPADAAVQTSRSRFFPTFGPDPADAVPFRYCSKASRAERNAGCADIPGSVGQHYGLTGQGPLPQQTPHHHRPQSNGHPTVKPTALMAWLCKLVTPEGGVVLDCFCGSGSTGVACVREGFGFLGIEQSAEYVAIARARIAHEQERRDGQLALPLGHAYG